MSRFGWGVAVGGGLGLLLCGGLAAPVIVSAGALFGGELKEAVTPASCGSAATTQLVGRQTVKIPDRSAAQVRNATTIIRTGQAMKVPPRGWVIAVATAIQESQLTNLGHLGADNDHDSQGMFQQRPSQGWGTPAQVRDPVYASRAFYARLLKVKGWQKLPLTVAAQRVQRSAYPDAYAKHEPEAARIVDAIADGAARTPAAALAAGQCAQADEVTSSGWVRPVSAPVGSGFRSGGRPGHDGVDLSTRRGTPIKAAAAGTVVHMECDNQSAPWYSCNRDGSPNTPGCGWYLDIRHAGGVITRYCHMLRRPLVSAGDKVAAGQQIGVVGTSGHSSGPHLHFEVHLRGDRSSSGAVDPVRFMRGKGASLGEGKGKEVSVGRPEDTAPGKPPATAWRIYRTRSRLLVAPRTGTGRYPSTPRHPDKEPADAPATPGKGPAPNLSEGETRLCSPSSSGFSRTS